MNRRSTKNVVAPGVGFEPTTCGLTDHRHLSESSAWTARARGFRAMCLSGMSVSVQLRAFCAMKCATRKPTRKAYSKITPAASGSNPDGQMVSSSAPAPLRFDDLLLRMKDAANNVRRDRG